MKSSKLWKTPRHGAAEREEPHVERLGELSDGVALAGVARELEELEPTDADAKGTTVRCNHSGRGARGHGVGEWSHSTAPTDGALRGRGTGRCSPRPFPPHWAAPIPTAPLTVGEVTPEPAHCDGSAWKATAPWT